MNKFIAKLQYTLKNKDTIIDILMIILPVICLVYKGVILQGFITNKDPYGFNFGAGYISASPFFKYYIFFSAIFISFSFLFKRRGRAIYLLITNFFVTLLYLLDIWYYRGFLTVPSARILTQTANLDNMGGSILSMTSPLDVLFIVDFILLVLLVIIFRKNIFVKKCRSIISFVTILVISLAVILYIPFKVNVLHMQNVSGSYVFSNYDPTNTERYFSAIGYHINDIYTVYKDSKPYAMTDEDKAYVKTYFEYKNENLEHNEYFGKAEGKNILYIQVESLENFVINQKIDGQEITPVLNSLLNSSYYFPNTFEQVNEGTSADCDLMVNTSMLPLRRGGTFFRYPDTDYNSMPKILKKYGYQTNVIHPDKGSFWNYQAGLTGGIDFENFYDSHSLDTTDQIGLGISDESYFNQVEPMIKNFKEPFYTMTITLTSHGPFDLPQDLRELKLNSELDNSELGGYFQSIHYTDKQIGNFLDKLKEDGLLDNTIVAIMGDHTGVHKYYNSSIENLSNKEDWFMFNGNPTMPFIIYDSSLNKKVQIDNYCGEIDVMPTLLYLIGVDDDDYQNTCLGRNMLNTNKSYAILTNGELRGGDDLSGKEKEVYKNSLEMSDKMIRANYIPEH
ncbi:LTA synthase family protein [Clostridium sp. BJN0001]|uniref:LTA synthase family protein n=1 Tax=Clostridium sp. BJN0001 TaxID=2930219 RepID=UPI001FD42055|nr:LTA synthase family protein [Clostridium sp. BJN0001]